MSGSDRKTRLEKIGGDLHVVQNYLQEGSLQPARKAFERITEDIGFGDLTNQEDKERWVVTRSRLSEKFPGEYQIAPDEMEFAIEVGLYHPDLEKAQEPRRSQRSPRRCLFGRRRRRN